MCKTAVFFGQELAQYSFGTFHPFNSSRVFSFWEKFNDSGLRQSSQSVIVKPVMANEDTILQFHDDEYVSLVKAASKEGRGFLDRGDTPAFKGVFEASCFVVGTSLKALEFVMEKKDGIVHAFNPIGGLHHARRKSAGGFCVFNDIGIMILEARKRYGVDRICYVDIDAHHGDGVYYEFMHDPLTYIADIHEDGKFLFPGTGSEQETGTGDAKDTKINICLSPQSSDNDFFMAFERVEEFINTIAKPELIILQCGADCIEGDPLTHLRYSPIAYRHASERLHELAHRFSDKKIIALGGGGYNQINIANGWTAVVQSFLMEL
ncbi:MAG: acetoin utilization protein AcuC [Thermoproteota archaeon]|nr:acetoin utilization protein AcuC [Thermoproteota archaeon]